MCARSSVGLEQQPSKLWVAGSNPAERANADMVELVDTTDLKSVATLRPGSTPGVRTNKHGRSDMNTLWALIGLSFFGLVFNSICWPFPDWLEDRQDYLKRVSNARRRATILTGIIVICVLVLAVLADL